MALIIVKFGGSSLGTPEGQNRALSIVKGHQREKKKIVVVVSAMGRRGDPYATDTLLHRLEVVNPEYSQRERDLLLSCGEIIAAVLMTERLQREGVKAHSFSGGQAGIVTKPSALTAEIQEIYPHKIKNALAQGVIPVVAGFQGVTRDGEVTTLGRGGSDLTATALGTALGAKLVEIYTDVEGMMTGDPRLIPQARILQQITFHEAWEMSCQGAQVIHPQAVEMAQINQLPVRITGTFSHKEGTLIKGEMVQKNPVTGLTSRRDVVYFSIDAPKDGGRMLDVFSPLAKNHVSLDFISVHEEGIRFLVGREKEKMTEQLLDERGFVYAKHGDLLKISLIGSGMTDRPGVMLCLVETMTAAGVEILQTTASHTTISVLVKKEKEGTALRALHTALGLDKKGEENFHEIW